MDTSLSVYGCLSRGLREQNRRRRQNHVIPWLLSSRGRTTESKEGLESVHELDGLVLEGWTLANRLSRKPDVIFV